MFCDDPVREVAVASGCGWAVVVRCEDSSLRYRRATKDGWEAWEQPKKAWADNELRMRNIHLAQHGDGTLDLFGTAVDDKQGYPVGTILHTWQDGSFEWFDEIYGRPGVDARDMTVGSDARGRLHLVAEDSNGDLHVTHRLSMPQHDRRGWSDWMRLAIGASRPALITVSYSGENPDRRLHLFARGRRGELWHQWHANLDPGQPSNTDHPVLIPLPRWYGDAT